MHTGLVNGLPALIELPPDVRTARLSIYNAASGAMEVIAGSGGCCEPVVLGGADPADFVLIGGDIVMFRSEP